MQNWEKKSSKTKIFKKVTLKVWKSPIYRRPKPYGSQKIGGLEAHPKVTRRLTGGLGKSDLLLNPRVTHVSKVLR